MTLQHGVEPVLLEADEASPSVDPWRAAWDSALRSVELDVEHAERMIEAMHAGDPDVSEAPIDGDWIAPSLLGPIPTEFADRARILLRRQGEVGERLAEAMVQARSQKRALGKFEPAERRPVFVDKAL